MRSFWMKEAKSFERPIQSIAQDELRLSKRNTLGIKLEYEMYRNVIPRV